MSDVVDLTSSPEDGRADRGRKRGREDDDAKQDDDNSRQNGSATAAAASSASSSISSPQAKRRKIIAAPLGRSGGAKTTGESSDDSDVICLDDSSSDDDERKPAARRRPSRPTDARNSSTRSVEAGGAIDLTTTSPIPNASDSNIARLAASVAASVAWRPAATAAAARIPAAAAASGPSPFATQATAYLDSVRGDLDHDKKREHFDDARRPEQILRKELSNLWDQLRSITDRRSEEYRVCRQQIDEVEAQLHQARKNAAEDIYNRNNSAERMGRVGADGRLTVDYHGLYVKDAIEAYETMVLPVLPVQTRVAIITGKGLHSKGGKSTLRDGLMEHIRRSAQCQEKKIECRVCPKNEGILLVDWIGEV